MSCKVSKDKHRVIIVDDNRYVLQILTKILRKADYCVTAVETGREMLKLLKKQTYDEAIIDVRLQDMNGLDLLNKSQKIAPNMKKIILTGYPSDEDRIRALEQGADHYLSKPIRSEKLIEIIEKNRNIGSEKLS
jgi:DNA-binding response OmpR family regulator